MKTPKEKAKELFDKMYQHQEGYQSDPDENAKECALICVEKNINMLTELVDSMSDFSNESRQVIWQLIENEEKVKEEIEKL